MRAAIAYISILALGLAIANSAFCEPQYKRKTIIDFDEALVEGKTRKPQSSFLSEKQGSLFSGLAEWSPDFNKKIEDSKIEVRNGL